MGKILLKSQPLPPGEFWKNSVFPIVPSFPLDTAQPYLSALDLLAKKVSKHLWHCPAGIFEKPEKKDDIKTRMSLAYLGRLLVQECEAAHIQKCKLNRSKAPPIRLTSRRRQKLVKDLNAVAAGLSLAPGDFLPEMQVVNKYINASPESFAPPLPAVRQIELWRSIQKQITPLKLAKALTALANEIAVKDHRKKPTNRKEQLETTLAAELVTWLRVATGAPYSYQLGGPVPHGGKSNYKVAAAFMKAAGFPHMHDDVIKNRLEARESA